MVYVGQMVLILLISFLGEALHALLPLPVPASIYGMVLMLLALCLKILPQEKIEKTADFLIAIMPVLFIPAGVGLMASWDALKGMLLPALLAVLVVTALVLGVSGWGAQGILRLERRRKHE